MVKLSIKGHVILACAVSCALLNVVGEITCAAALKTRPRSATPYPHVLDDSLSQPTTPQLGVMALSPGNQNIFKQLINSAEKGYRHRRNGTLDGDGTTKICRAIDVSNVKEVESLIESGADVNQVSGDSQETPLHRAVAQHRVSWDVSFRLVELLIAARANVDLLNAGGQLADADAPQLIKNLFAVERMNRHTAQFMVDDSGSPSLPCPPRPSVGRYKKQPKSSAPFGSFRVVSLFTSRRSGNGRLLMQSLPSGALDDGYLPSDDGGSHVDSGEEKD